MGVQIVPRDIRAYGARGADDTIAIRAALADATTIVFPEGIWRWTDTLDVTDKTIKGAGNNSTFLVFDDPTGVKNGMVVGHGTFNLRDCNYDRKQPGKAGALIHFTDSYWCSIEGNRFDGPNAWNVITVDSATVMPNQFSVRHNLVHEFINDFVLLNSQNAAWPVYDFHAHDNLVSSSKGRAAFELLGYGQLELHDNTMTGGSQYNVYIDTVAAPTINGLSRLVNNDFDAAIVNGLFVRNHNDITVIGGTGKTSYINVAGLYISGGVNFWPTTMTNCAGVYWNGTVQGDNPFTVDGGKNLNFAGSWNFGTGTFVTLLNTPLNVTTTGVVQGI